MKKIIGIFLAIFIYTISAGNINAQSIKFTPSTPSVGLDQTIKLQIVVDESNESNKAIINLVFAEGIVVNSFTKVQNPNLTYVTGECSPQIYTSKEICFELSTTTNFNDGDILGQIELTGKSIGAYDVNYLIGSQLTDGSSITKLTGSAFTIKVSEEEPVSMPISLPINPTPTNNNTSNKSSNDNMVLILAGAILGMGAMLMIVGVLLKPTRNNL